MKDHFGACHESQLFGFALPVGFKEKDQKKLARDEPVIAGSCGEWIRTALHSPERMVRYLLSRVSVKPMDIAVNGVDGPCASLFCDLVGMQLVCIAASSSAQVNLLRGPSEDDIQPREKFFICGLSHLGEHVRKRPYIRLADRECCHRG